MRSLILAAIHKMRSLILAAMASGMLSPKMLSYEEGAMSEAQAGKIRQAAVKRTILAMSFAGQNLADYHQASVESVRSKELHVGRYLMKARKIAHDIFKSVHFLADYGHFCHRDLKMFNVAINPPFEVFNPFLVLLLQIPTQT